jgi:CheY-like chemotaxis protein/predicted GIY-YIG superfamily endonuclease
VYIVRCADGTLYTGYARDPQAREKAHNEGRGAKYTAGRRPVALVYSEACESAGDALRRERQLKRESRAAKEALIRRSGPDDMLLAIPRKAAPRHTVLVVDDFSDGREMVAEYLQFRGFETHEAASGIEAIEKAIAVRPRVILMDLAMMNMDGWEATRRIKNDPRTRDIIVIAVTAHALEPDEAAAREAGCDGYIAKPYDLAYLCDLITRALRHGVQVLRAGR